MNTLWGQFPREPFLETKWGSWLCSSFLPCGWQGAGCTFSRLETAAGSHGALLPQGRHQGLQLLQSVQKILDVGSRRATAGSAGDVDTVCEDDLVFPVDRVLLEALSGLWWWGQVLLPTGWFQIHWALGTDRQLDVVDVVKHYRLLFLWQSDIDPALSLVPDDFLEDPTFSCEGERG